MAIRIRVVEGETVALCAAETDPQPGDVYLDDAIHYALTLKFMRDFHSTGFLREGITPDPDPKAESQRVRDARASLREWLISEEVRIREAEAAGRRVELFF